MKIESIPLDQLIPDPSNARKHSEKNLNAIRGSLTKFGQQKPIVVNSKNIIIAGNGTYAAAKAMGWSELKCVRSELDNFMQTAFALADNKTAELAEWDRDVLVEQLNQLDLNDFDIGDIGFDLSLLKADSLESLLGDKPTKYILEIELPNAEVLNEEYEKLIASGLIVRIKNG